MKKIALLYLITLTASVQAQTQEVVDSVDNCKQNKVLFLNKEFDTKNCIVNDSLAIEERFVSFPKSVKSIYNSLQFISKQDEMLQPFVEVNDSIATVKATFTAEQVSQGVVLQALEGNDFSVVYYNNEQPLYRYVLDSDNHFYTYVRAEIEKNEDVRDLFYDIEEGDVIPSKENYIDNTWKKWDESAEKTIVDFEGKQGELIRLNNQITGTEQLLFKIGDEKGALHYLYLEKKEHDITVYEQSFTVVDGQLKGGFVNNAVILNVGFDRKRITARTEKGKSISDIYFENFAPNDWKQPNQYLFDYIRNSNKKVLRARVVLDASIEKDSLFFDVLVALANNPELFRRDVELKDFSFEKLESTHILELSGDKKALFTLK